MFGVKVSVITCLYNGDPELFDQCLSGLLNQTFKHFEILVVDDGSSKYIDENLAIIKKYNDSRIKFLQKEHSGKSQTLNYALNYAQGEYIAINDCDDVSYPHRLFTQMAWLDNNPQYDLVSNSMIRVFDNTVFPDQFKYGFEINKSNVYYCVNHPCSMFRKSCLEKLPFKFCQMYDATEDNVMNHIMFYYGVKMWHNPEILLEYGHHSNQVHWNNIRGFLKEVIYKLSYCTFGAKHDDAKTTCLLFVNDKWTIQDIEKTILNIRLTSNNVNIFICSMTNKFNLSYMDKYNVKTIVNSNEHNEHQMLNKCCESISTDNIMLISTPVRFYNHNWDLYFERELDRNKYHIYEPFMFDMEKIDEDNFKNENGKENRTGILCGERLNMFCDVLTEKQTEYDIRTPSEYVYDTHIPILSNTNVFICKTFMFKNVMSEESLDYCSTNNLFNVMFSIIAYCKYGAYIFKKLDLTCSYVKFDNITNYGYYLEFFAFTKLFLSETQYIHQKIINDILKSKFHIDPLNDSDFILKPIKCDQMSFSDFLKKINNKQQWIY